MTHRTDPETMPCKQQRGEISEPSALFPFAVNFNLKAIDHIDGSPAIRQLTSRQLAELRMEDCWRGPCTVEPRPNAQAPLHRHPVREMGDGFHWQGEFTPVPGEVLHNCLKEK